MRVETLGAFERHLRAAAARPKTISTYCRIVGLFLKFCGSQGVEALTPGDIEAFLARPRATSAAPATATRNLELVALRRFFRSRQGVDPTGGMELKRPERRDPAVPNGEELRAMFEAAARGPHAARNLAILALLYQAGLRVHELALTVDQVDLEGAALTGAFGKGGIRCDIPIGQETVALLRAWLAAPSAEGEPLFPGAERTGSARHLSVRTIERLVARVRADAGLHKPITPHSLRHAAATQAIARGVDLPSVAALLRHRRIETTMLYVALASDARRGASARIGAAIPRSVLPTASPTAENPSNTGGPDAVDAEHRFSDAA